MDTGVQILGQLLVAIGVALVVLGAVVAAIQAGAILQSRDRSSQEEPAAPSIGAIAAALMKRVGSLAIAALGFVVLVGGLQVMNHGVKTDVGDDLQDKIERTVENR